MKRAQQNFNKLEISPRKLRQIDIASLARLSDAIQTLSEVSNGLLAQPCFWCEEAHEWTDAGDILERINAFLDRYRAQLVEIISNATPSSESDAVEMAWARVRYEADLGADLPEFAQMVSQMAATYRKGTR